MNAQARGAMTFGSKEWNAYYHGRNKDAKRAKGDTAKRANTALKKSLTKKAEREELNRRRGEFEAEGAKLAKAQQAEDRATARILGSGAHALKLTKPQGNFTAEDVQAFQRQGWSVHPAGTAPAKVGSSLSAKKAFRLNPSTDPLVKILGPGLEARAVVIASPEAMTEDTVEAWRRAGYDVSAAPKKFRQGAKVNPFPATSGVKARQGAPERGTSKKKPVQAGSMPVSRSKPKAPKANPTKATETAREALEQAWERWTGAKVGASLTLTLPDRGDCPASVVMLGRVSELIAPTGAVKAFGETGPFMVTDGRMKRVWLIDGKGKRFDLDLTRGLIAYLAKKHKFGDRAPVKYVHHFAGKAHAAMSGHVGELTGTFRLTPRGIEG